MAVVALDTHAVVKELQAAGFSEAQAEAVTRAVRKGQDLDLSHLATKADIDGLRLATQADLESLRVATKADIDGLRQQTKAEFDGLRRQTKADIDGLRQQTRADIDGLRRQTKADIAELKADLLKWMVSTIGLQTVAILGALVGLARILRP